MEVQNGGMVIIKGDNIENGGLKIVKNYGQDATEEKKTKAPLTDAELMEKIERVRKHIGTVKRLWFPVCKYMMWHRMVAEGDFVTAVAKLEELYPGLGLSAHDLSKMNALSFQKTSDKWDANNAPVANATFGKYMAVAELMDI